MKPKLKILIFLIFVGHSAWSQMQHYTYERKLPDVSEGWYKIIIPDEMYNKISADFRDIRIFGITAKNDTIESPYLLKVLADKVNDQNIRFKILNTSHNEKGYYFTFETDATEPVNQITFDFRQKNFDWQVTLEGSQNQQEWFTLIEKYRILSIKNPQTDFRYTTLSFQDSKYRFYRLFIESKTSPELLSATITQHHTTDGEYKSYLVNNFVITNNKETKETIADVELKQPVPVSFIKISVHNKFDFYRPLTIEYLVDSFKTEQGWKYNYRTMTTGILNSIGSNEFSFPGTIAQRLRLYISNLDNQPLTIDSILVKGYVHELIVRITGKANYFLVYGNKEARLPTYDLNHFTEKIPDTLQQLIPENEMLINQGKISGNQLLFQNKIWLWIVITLAILILGWFTIRMMKKA